MSMSKNKPVVNTIGFSAASAGANVSEVTITVKDALGQAIPVARVLDVWLSDVATGLSLTSTTTSGTVTAKAASGAVMATFTAKKYIQVTTLATGVFTLEITDSAKTTFYVCARINGLEGIQVSAILTTGNYG